MINTPKVFAILGVLLGALLAAATIHVHYLDVREAKEAET